MNLEIIEIKCQNCGKELFIQEEYVREKMFCTLGCMDSYSETAYMHA